MLARLAFLIVVFVSALDVFCAPTEGSDLVGEHTLYRSDPGPPRLAPGSSHVSASATSTSLERKVCQHRLQSPTARKS